jgi:putative ATP-dependent endonuclease of OLD family
LEALGVCTVDAGSETNIPGMAQLYRKLGKHVYAICDKQGVENKALIEAQVELLLMHGEKGFEAMVLKSTTEVALNRFANLIEWPQHLFQKYAVPGAQTPAALMDYFAWSKGTWGIADFLVQCSEEEMPEWLRNAAVELKAACVTATVEGSESLTLAEAGVPPEAGTNGSD